jgi:hypothetical protein
LPLEIKKKNLQKRVVLFLLTQPSPAREGLKANPVNLILTEVTTFSSYAE